MAEFNIYKDDAGEWRWKLQAGNNETIADSGEGYTRRTSCVDAVKRVKRDAGSALVYDTSERPKTLVTGA
ncbi:DUF1508 domain-containing protein [Longimicrobium terrae]|uniref:Uncharacterized protein YegP (UPF0339 family) n=1 Tax=Longimicrobium terrae TaxID=1639882 RepID=A0A841GVM1_9BACT|nr:uncharacterized protein YegP (UPF0339 family) [Longimicrobium terrae]MBB6069514.1 uncharacterized protein YegP (UPF0339 family) [Longimicrobium terrae]NNC31684.1 DUF1508 domain-containing protein [Longimicrobium terrae]